MDNLTKDQRRLNMSRIRSSNTKLEQSFLDLLNEDNIPFTDHPKLYGKPDYQIGDKLLIFVDSDFWHGWHFNQWKNRMPKKYWIQKIEGNIARDRRKSQKLKRSGFVVIRIWEHELKNKMKVINKLKKFLLK